MRDILSSVGISKHPNASPLASHNSLSLSLKLLDIIICFKDCWYKPCLVFRVPVSIAYTLSTMVPYLTHTNYAIYYLVEQ
jgi:hypothetical protein